MPYLLAPNALAFSGTHSTAAESIVRLESAENVEIQHALQHWKNEEHGDAQSVSKETFPLPSLGPRLQEITQALHLGRGFAVLRGLELAKTPEDNMVMYLGISSYVGSQRGMCEARVGLASLRDLQFVRRTEQEAGHDHTYYRLKRLVKSEFTQQDVDKACKPCLHMSPVSSCHRAIMPGELHVLHTLSIARI